MAVGKGGSWFRHIPPFLLSARPLSSCTGADRSTTGLTWTFADTEAVGVGHSCCLCWCCLGAPKQRPVMPPEQLLPPPLLRTDRPSVVSCRERHALGVPLSIDILTRNSPGVLQTASHGEDAVELGGTSCDRRASAGPACRRLTRSRKARTRTSTSRKGSGGHQKAREAGCREHLLCRRRRGRLLPSWRFLW